MWVKTFLVGLRLAAMVYRAYVNRNRDGLEENTSGEEMAWILNAYDAIQDVINILQGSPVMALGKRVKRNSPEYQAVLANLRETRKSEARIVRTPAKVEVHYGG